MAHGREKFSFRLIRRFRRFTRFADFLFCECAFRDIFHVQHDTIRGNAGQRKRKMSVNLECLFLIGKFAPDDGLLEEAAAHILENIGALAEKLAGNVTEHKGDIAARQGVGGAIKINQDKIVAAFFPGKGRDRNGLILRFEAFFAPMQQVFRSNPLRHFAIQRVAGGGDNF